MKKYLALLLAVVMTLSLVACGEKNPNPAPDDVDNQDQQTEPVSDVVKETTYRIYFVDGNGEKISNEHLYIADKKDENTANRVFRLRFNFKNKKYEKSQKYYLVACRSGRRRGR